MSATTATCPLCNGIVMAMLDDSALDDEWLDDLRQLKHDGYRIATRPDSEVRGLRIGGCACDDELRKRRLAAVGVSSKQAVGQ
jgi:hypothetical protein